MIPLNIAFLEILRIEYEHHTTAMFAQQFLQHLQLTAKNVLILTFHRRFTFKVQSREKLLLILLFF